jgi:hypothetical protein
MGGVVAPIENEIASTAAFAQAQNALRCYTVLARSALQAVVRTRTTRSPQRSSPATTAGYVDADDDGRPRVVRRHGPAGQHA